MNKLLKVITGSVIAGIVSTVGIIIHKQYTIQQEELREQKELAYIKKIGPKIKEKLNKYKGAIKSNGKQK